MYQVDPLLCTRCGKRISTIAFVTDQLAIGRILDHLGLSTPEAEKPPPPVPELLRVAERGDGWGAPAVGASLSRCSLSRPDDGRQEWGVWDDFRP